jgi:hypothetical protein
MAVAEKLLRAGVPSTAEAIQHTEGLGSEDDVYGLLRECLSRSKSYEQTALLLQTAIQHGYEEFAQLLREAMDWREASCQAQQ